MKLRQYLRVRRITMRAFAQQFDPPISAGKVNHWLRGARRVSLEEALQIEVLTGGEVGLLDLVHARRGNSRSRLTPQAPAAINSEVPEVV